jgi:hypothetical protein
LAVVGAFVVDVKDAVDVEATRCEDADADAVTEAPAAGAASIVALPVAVADGCLL